MSLAIFVINFLFQIDAYFSTFIVLLKERNPNIVKHLENYGISKEVFLVEWFYTLYSRAFKMHTVSYEFFYIIFKVKR
jgi:hypothetical protein